MKIISRFFLWCLILAALTGLFYLRAGTSGVDERTPLALLTAGGVEHVSMAEYLPLAVAAEMPASFAPEALKAQAVAVRTFVLANDRHAAQSADVCTDSGCCVAYLDRAALRQRWGEDYGENMAKIAAAAAATDGEYLAYDGRAIQAAFHASSLGCTEDSGALWSPLPYLVSVQTPETPEAAPGLITETAVSASELVQALGFNPGRDPAGWLGPLETNAAGRVSALTVCGRRYTGAEIRSALGLRSTAFTVRWEDGGFRFTVSGYGHGVGMSQYGAQTYAGQGASYRDILSHYYPGTTLEVYCP